MNRSLRLMVAFTVIGFVTGLLWPIGILIEAALTGPATLPELFWREMRNPKGLTFVFFMLATIGTVAGFLAGTVVAAFERLLRWAWSGR
ncbi:hypothetical protein [Ruegeria arenilitoris]|uniref:hypothetical protein n=1 Tax=Ruegeria arenilitoris TaxID=1173585 RepID=UPI00147C3FA2|nr:hypothetical protein [Ruegeria arenilitoris]